MKRKDWIYLGVGVLAGFALTKVFSKKNTEKKSNAAGERYYGKCVVTYEKNGRQVTAGFPCGDAGVTCGSGWGTQCSVEGFGEGTHQPDDTNAFNQVFRLRR